jgi:hypothetical protein
LNQSNDNTSDNEFYFAGKETKTETETTTKVDIDKTIETKTTATPNADTTPSKGHTFLVRLSCSCLPSTESSSITSDFMSTILHLHGSVAFTYVF